MYLGIASVAVGLAALSFTLGQGQSPLALAWGLLGYFLAGFAHRYSLAGIQRVSVAA